MASVSTTTGLVSGIDWGSIIDQLMEIEKQPVYTLQTRIKTAQSQQDAVTELTARLLSLKLSTSLFSEPVMFERKTGASSNTDVLGVSANSDAVPGSYSFTVARLASNHQVASRGFADAARTSIGTGQIRFESAAARVDGATQLNVLNGMEGVRRGTIRITDRSGATADVDLTNVLTVQDVLDAINSTSGIGVTASVSGNHLVLTDTTGSTAVNLQVSDIGGGHTAADLGIRTSVAAGRLAGSDLFTLTDNMSLASVNDGNRIRTVGGVDDLRVTLRDGTTQIGADLSGQIKGETRLAALNHGAGVRGGSIRITDRAGAQATVDLSGATTVQDVLNAINAAAVNVTASLGTDGNLKITDNNTLAAGTTPKNLKIEDLDGGYAAADLGIAADVADTKITGELVYEVTTIGDVIRAINLDPDNGGKLTAAISADGQSITLTDNVGGASDLVVEDGLLSKAATDLGLVGGYASDTATGTALFAGLNSVLLRNLHGTTGSAALGTISITDRSGTTSSIDLSAAKSLQDVMDAINDSSVAADVTASYNDSRTGIVITDNTAGTGNLVISGTGAGADGLGIEVDAAVSSVEGVNLQKRYLSEATLLAEMNGGAGVKAGKFTLTDANYRSATVDLTQGERTVGQVISEINSRGLAVHARINDNGDGILLEDTSSGGSGHLKVVEAGSTTAKDLGLLGEDTGGLGYLDGSFEIAVDVDASDSLEDLVAKINASGATVQAAVINDGSGVNAYRLALTSTRSGKAGQLVIQDSTGRMGFTTLSEGRDARVFFGSPNAAGAVLVQSSTNTIKNAVKGVTLTLNNASASPVTVTVSRDIDTIAGQASSFVDAFNGIISRIDELTKYDVETQTRSLLQGDATIQAVRSSLINAVLGSFAGAGGTLTSLTQAGISIGSGNTLTFDEGAFRTAFEENPEAVKTLFSAADTGFGDRLEKLIDGLTDSHDGTLTRKSDSYDDRISLFNDRIDRLNSLIEAKRARLEKQYQAMEEALSKMQSQMSALQSFTSSLSSSSSSSSS